MFKRIYFFFASYIVATTYSQTLLLFWFFKNGLSELNLLFYVLFQCVASLLIYFIVQGKSIESRKSLFLGVLFSFSGVLFASLITHPYHAFIVSFMFGLTNVFFWTIYNTMYFKYSEKGEHGFKSGMYFLLFPIIGAIFAPFSGFIAERFSFSFLFFSSFFFYIIPLFFIYFLPSFIFKFEVKEAFFELENKLLVFMQGYISMFRFAFISIFTLFFITTPFKFGSFFGYLAILSALTALLNSRISDKTKNRAFFFYFFTVLDSLTYIPMALAKSFTLWQVFTGINNITTNLSDPFSVTLVLDHAKLNRENTMLAREIYLNLGRICIVVIAIFVLYLSGSFMTSFLIVSFGAILYPITAYYKKIYLK